jgi:uncharacterized protein YndB with AHSA1/START domain
MKILQWALAVVGTIALAAVVVGAFLPSTFSVQRSIEIAAPAGRIYDYIVEPRKWSQWSVWTRRDPNMRITYAGPPFGMGARWSWESKSEGSGAMEFTRVDPDKRVEYALFFPAFNMRSSGELAIASANGHTRVTWTNKGDVGGNPLKHYLAAAMDRLVGPDFEQGLANLKALAEKS